MTKSIAALAQALAWTIIASSTALAQGQTEATKAQATETRLAAIEKNLAEIKGLLQTLLLQGARTAQPAGAPRTAPAGAVSFTGELQVAKSAIQGDPNAKLVIVEFSDYQCPYCGRHARETLKQLRQSHISTGSVAYVFKNLPIQAIHPLAFKVAEAVECAGQQSKFWEMHDRIFSEEGALTKPELVAGAKALSLDLKLFDKCLDGGMTEKIWADMADAKRLGISATPAFLIGRRRPDGTIELMRKIAGAQPYAVFVTTLQEVASSMNTSQ